MCWLCSRRGTLGFFLAPRFFLALSAVLLPLAGCAEVPSVDGQIASTKTVAPRIEGADGPLSEKRSQAILSGITREAGDSGMLQRHLAIEEAVSESPLVAGNRTTLLRDGPRSFHAVFAAIAAARDYVNLEYYILEDIKSDEQSLSDLLVAKRQQGVAVNIIFDSYGSLNTPKAFFDKLRQAGVNLVEFNPVDPLAAKSGYSLNDRDHRKILIVDGGLAIIGGVNISTSYQSMTFGKSGSSGTSDGPIPQHWRDTDLQIEGPAVAQLSRLFARHWAEQKGPPIDQSHFYPTVEPRGKDVIRVVGSQPSREISRYYVTLISAIRNAEKSIWLSAAYFVPSHEEKEALEEAAKRGVDVRLLLPDESDSAAAVAVAHSHYEDLMEAGVKIYETQGIVLHSKTVVIDHVWSAIGSSNFDQRSVLFNDEVDAVVLGGDTADALAAMFEEDVARAKRIDPESWEDRPLSEKMHELFARTWQNLL
ncbi:MAG TPA: phospholipase D-like domain-containing protein [Dongiaceae bacterium]|nr:phospholipase D-like domain-containing protein [Dongiaceae bacterium]